ncbi:MAG: hypothetical protein K8R59_08385 [Thermoanaerobaculales bacterium]|nr:hypothetical protein [Thermoanaerobaculales bacterium]
MLWVRRITAIILFSLGCALLFLSFPDSINWSVETPWLRMVARGVGSAFLLGGLFLLFAVYREAAARPGIPVSSVWLAVFCDTICLLGGAFFATITIDTLWVGPLGMPTMIGLEPEYLYTTPITGLHFVSVLAFLFVLPILSLWFTSLSAQRIAVDEEQVRSFGVLGVTTVKWQELKTISLRDQHSPLLGATGDFRRVQKVVDLEGEGSCITINRPSSNTRKMMILGALREHIPGGMEHLLEGLDEGW